MDQVQFFSASRLLVVAGKGGVGKTTVTAVLATAAARTGRKVLVLDVEGRPGLLGLLGGDADAIPTYDGVAVASAAGSIEVRLIGPGDSLREYLQVHGFGRLSGRLAASGVLDVVSTAAPGIEDILVLGKVKQLERSEEFDLIVLDGPAAGHAIPFLRAAHGLADSVRVGPIQAQARDVAAMLSDHERCQVLLVTLPEPTPVNELVETAFALEDTVGVALAPVVVNAVYPSVELPDPGSLGPPGSPLHDAAVFRSARQVAQGAQLADLAARLPLPRMTLPFVFTAGLSPADVERLADELLTQIEALG